MFISQARVWSLRLLPFSLVSDLTSTNRQNQKRHSRMSSLGAPMKEGGRREGHKPIKSVSYCVCVHFLWEAGPWLSLDSQRAETPVCLRTMCSCLICSFCRQRNWGPKTLHYFFQYSDYFCKVTQLSIDRALKAGNKNERRKPCHFTDLSILGSNIVYWLRAHTRES